MVIDKTNILTRVLGVLSAIGAIIGLVLTIRGFVLYRFIMALVNLAVAFICFVGGGKDKEISILVYGGLMVYSLVHIFVGDGTTVLNGILQILRIVCYLLFIAYFLQVLTKKVFPIVGGVVVGCLSLWNVYTVIEAHFQLQHTMAQLGGPVNTVVFGKSTVMTVVGTLTYAIPPLVYVMLIAAGLIKFGKRG